MVHTHTHTLVSFSVNAETKIGEKVHLSGDTISLGGFKVMRSVELVTTPEEYPIWRTPKKFVLLTDKPLEYRYAIFSGGNFCAWEPLHCRSRRVVPHTSKMDIVDVFGRIDQHPFEQQQHHHHHIQQEQHQESEDAATAAEMGDRAQPLSTSANSKPKMTGSISSNYLHMGTSPTGAAGEGGWAATADASISSERSRSSTPPQPYQIPVRSISGTSTERTDTAGSSSYHQRRRSAGSSHSVGLGNPQLSTYGYTASPPQIFYARSPDSINSNSPDAVPSRKQHHTRVKSAGAVPSLSLGATAAAGAAAEGMLRIEQLANGEPVRDYDSNASCGSQGIVDEASKTDSVLLVAFHLPVLLSCVDPKTNKWKAEWDRDNPFARSDGSSIADKSHVKWIGAISQHALSGAMKEEIWNFDEATKEAIRKALAPMNCIPIILTKETYEIAYKSFCKWKLRNVFHNVLDLTYESERRADADAHYNEFSKMNQIFADEVVKHMHKSLYHDLVWIHDYHLMLVPKMIRDSIDKLNKQTIIKHQQQQQESAAQGAKSKATTARQAPGPPLLPAPRIVLFLHIPFPTSEIFRTLAIRNELLLGMLNANLVGFHTFGHARHFLTACKRFLGLQYHSRKGGTLMVDFVERSVLISVSHVSIEPERLDAVLANPTVAHNAQRIRNTHHASHSQHSTHHGTKNNKHSRNKTIISGLAELERLKGVPLKLLAYEMLLNECPRYRRGRTIFILHGVRSSSFYSEDAQRSAAEVKKLVARINNAHGPVVEYHEHDAMPNVEVRVALWKAADIMISTPVMEGLNLLPLEYQFVHSLPAGVVILSEFSANSRVLNGAIRVNSYDIAEISNALDKAIQMSEEERNARRARDIDYIKSRKSSLWTRDIIDEVEASVLEFEGGGSEEQNSLEDATHCRELDRPAVKAAYAKASRRLILLDYGGTICERELENLIVKNDFLGVSKRPLSKRVLQTIRRLTADPRNAVFIVSGNSRTVLSANFKHLLSEPDGGNLGLVAHSGLCIRWGKVGLELGAQRRRVAAEAAAAAAALVAGATNEPQSPVSEVGAEGEGFGEHGNDVNEENVSRPETFPRHMDKRIQEAELRFRAEGWDTVLKGVSQEWADWMDAANVPDLLEDAAWHTCGSSWRQSPVTTIWDFRQADPEQGDMQANVLQLKLEKAIEQINVPVTVVRKKNSLQLLPKGVSKGTAVKHILEGLPARWGGDMMPDFALCIGDDLADELMFTQLLDSISQNDEAHMYRPFRHSMSSTCSSSSSSVNGEEAGAGGVSPENFGPNLSDGDKQSSTNAPVHSEQPEDEDDDQAVREIFTVTVGRKPTEARYYVNDANEVVDLLAELTEVDNNHLERTGL